MAIHSQQDEVEEKLRIVSDNPGRDLSRIFRALLREIKVDGSVKHKRRPRRYFDAYDPAEKKFILESRGLYLRTQFKEGSARGRGYCEQTIKMALGCEPSKLSKNQKAMARREFKDEIPSLKPSLSAVAAKEVQAKVADIRNTSLMQIFTAKVSRRYFNVVAVDGNKNKGLLEIAFDHGFLEFPDGRKVAINEIEIELKDARSHKYPGVAEAMREWIVDIAQRLGIEVVPENETKGTMGFKGARENPEHYEKKAAKLSHWKRDKPRKY